MTWEELKQKAKELGYKEIRKLPREKTQKVLWIETKNGDTYCFYPDGTVETDVDGITVFCGYPFAYKRTPKQMLQIMEALQ